MNMGLRPFRLVPDSDTTTEFPSVPALLGIAIKGRPAAWRASLCGTPDGYQFSGQPCSLKPSK